MPCPLQFHCSTRHSIHQPRRIHMHVMVHAEAPAEISDYKSSGQSKRNDEDADDACRFAVANRGGGQLKSHERQSHGVTRSQQDNAAGRPGGTHEVHDCQKHQCGHEQRQPDAQVCSDPACASHARGFLHICANLNQHAFHNIHSGGLSLQDDDDEQRPDAPEKEIQQRSADEHPQQSEARENPGNGATTPDHQVQRAAAGQARAHQNIADHGKQQRADNGRGGGQNQGGAQCFNEYGIGQYELPMFERKTEHEVSYSGHKASEDQYRQWPYREQYEKKCDYTERNVVPSPDIDETGPEATGDGCVAAPLQDPPLQGDNECDHQEGNARQHGCFTVIGDRVSNQREDFFRVNIKSKGHTQEILRFERLKHPQKLQSENQYHRRSHQRKRNLEERSQIARASHSSSFFERSVHVAESRRKQHDFDSDSVPHQVCPNDTWDSEDVERTLIQQQKFFQRDVDHANVRVQERDPGDGHGKRWHHVRNPEHKFQSMAERNLRAR